MNRTIRLKNALITAGTTIVAAMIVASASVAFAADTTPPSTPTGLSAAAISLSQINLSWTVSTDNVGVTGYGVFRNGLQVGTTSATTYSDIGLLAGTSYSYAIDAFDAAGNLSTQSASVSTSTLSDTTAPSVPTSLSATPVSSSQVNLSWAASTDNVGVTGYTVYRNGSSIGSPATNSFSDTGLAASTAYTYTVSAHDAAGNTSAQSAGVSATTLASGSVTSPVSVPPTVDITSNGNITIRGMTVTGIGTNTFTGTVWGITYTVNYNGTATPGNNGRGHFEFLLRGGNSANVNASQIQVGDIVGVQGSITQAAPTVITAQVVRNYSITTPRVPKQDNDGRGTIGTINGVVSSSTGVGGGNNIANIQSLFQQLKNQFKNFKGNGGKGNK